MRLCVAFPKPPKVLKVMAMKSRSSSLSSMILLVLRAAFVVGVDVGGRTTCSPTRRVVDVSVDGRVRDADVQDRFAVVRHCARP